MSELARQFTVLRGLNKPGWDGRSADPIPTHLVDVAERALQLLGPTTQQPAVGPSSEGEVDLSWVAPPHRLWLSLDVDEFVYNLDLGETVCCGWTDSESLERCAEQLGRVLRELLGCF